MERIVFSVAGEPQGKARPKFSSAHGKPVAFTPDKTVFYENMVRMEYSRAAKGARFADDAQISVSIKACFSVPKSIAKSRLQRMMDGKLRPTKKPDVDNICKIICDALNGIAYRDDAQIVEAVVEKWYAPNAKVEVCLTEIGRKEK